MSEGKHPLQNLDEQIESRVQGIRADRNWWPCRRGCDHCCRQLAHPPELSPAEWERVDAAVTNLPASVQLVVEQEIDALLRRIVERVLSSAVVCPYLDEQEGACRIYDARPIACRTYGFYIARDHDQYCKQIETEIHNRGEDTIVWGNAESMRRDLEQISGMPIPFEVHYRDRLQRLSQSDSESFS